MAETDEEDENPNSLPIFQNNNEEFIPDEVLNNITSNYKKEEPKSNLESNAPPSRPCSCSCFFKKLLIVLLIIFMVIVNYAPLVTGILELIFRKGDGVLHYVIIGFEFLYYFCGTISTIDTLCSNKNFVENSLNIGMMVFIAIFFTLEIILFFASSDYGRGHPDEFVNSFCTYRVFCLIVTIVIDIIAFIISYLCKLWKCDDCDCSGSTDIGEE